MARDFNGTTDRLDYGNVFDPSSNANGWTIAGFVFPDTVNRATPQYFWNAHLSGDAAFGSVFFISASAQGVGSLTASIVRATTATSRLTNTAQLSASAWSHVAARWSGGTLATTLKMFVNGAEVSGYAVDTNGSGTASPATGSHSLGGRIFDDVRNIDGRLAEWGLWDVELTDAELASLAKGLSPLCIRPDNLRYVWALVRSIQDVVGGQAGTADGTTVIEHPRVFYPAASASRGVAPTILLAGATISSGATLTVPTVTGGGGGSTSVTNGTVATTATLYAPALRYTQTLVGTTISAGSTLTAPGVKATIDDSFEGSSVNVSGSSVSGLGDSATITLKPRVQETEGLGGDTRWLAPKARVSHVNGYRPTFVLSDYGSGSGKYHGYPWNAGRRMKFSYDGETWTSFDTAHTIGATTITFRHSTAFTQDVVYIAWGRMRTPTQVGAWIDALEASYPTLIHQPPSNVSGFISGTFAAQTDELSRTIPAQPFYAFKLADASLSPTDGSAKRTAVFEAGVHAGEDQGDHVLKYLVEFLCGSDAAAIKVRRHFNIFVYPLMNAPGRAGGGWRGSFTNGTGGEDDANRHFSDAVAPIEIVSIPRGKMTIDLPGIVQVSLHSHGMYDDDYGFYNETAAHALWDTAVEVHMGSGVVADVGDSVAGFVGLWFANTKGTKFYITIETGEPTPLSDANLQTWGEAQGKAIATLLDAGSIAFVVEAATIASGSAVTAPRAAYKVVGATIASGAAVSAPTVKYRLALPTIASGATLTAPTARYRVAGVAIASGAQVHTPSVGALITASLASGAQLFGPTVAGGAVTVAGSTITSTANTFVPVAAYLAQLPTMTSGATLYAPRTSYRSAGAAIGSTATLTEPTVSPGAVTVTGNSIVLSPTLYAGTVNQPFGQGVTASTIVTTATIFGPRVSRRGAVRRQRLVSYGIGSEQTVRTWQED